jgi:hypothetical protein
VQQILGGVGAGVGAEQDRRLARVEGEPVRAAGVLCARGVEVLDRGAVVRSAEPAVAGAELELRDLGLRLDRVQGGEQRRGVHAVSHGLGDGRGHVVLLWFGGWSIAP